MLIDIFKTSIFKTKIEDSYYKEYFVKILNEEKTKIKSTIKSNIGGYQTRSDLTINAPQLIKTLFLNPAKEFITQLTPKKELNLTLKSFWINENKQCDYNLLHNHSPANISGVYYLKVPKDSGRLVFQTGDSSKFNDNNFDYFNNNNFACRYFFDVQEYELYLFSGSTFHYVEPNRSNEERISVSFNIEIF